ncbi:preprotein translocase subunit YajC [Vallitaleaceae bacterium 9-2]
MNQILVLLEAGAGAPAGGLTSLLLIYGAIFAIFWFFIIRPQRKKQKQIDAMQNSIEVGNSVLTSGGLFGKVVDVINNVVVVEFGTNKSVRVPVQKSAIVSVTEPDMSIAKEVTEESKSDDKKSDDK